MGGIRQHSVLAVVEEAVAPAAVADEEERSQENQGTDGAGFPLQQEAEQVEAHEHGVVEPQGRVQRLGDEQHGEQPLQAIHRHVWFGGVDRDLMGCTILGWMLSLKEETPKQMVQMVRELSYPTELEWCRSK